MSQIVSNSFKQIQHRIKQFQTISTQSQQIPKTVSIILRNVSKQFETVSGSFKSGHKRLNTSHSKSQAPQTVANKFKHIRTWFTTLNKLRNENTNKFPISHNKVTIKSQQVTSWHTKHKYTTHAQKIHTTCTSTTQQLRTISTRMAQQIHTH